MASRAFEGYPLRASISSAMLVANCVLLSASFDVSIHTRSSISPMSWMDACRGMSGGWVDGVSWFFIIWTRYKETGKIRFSVWRRLFFLKTCIATKLI